MKTFRAITWVEYNYSNAFGGEWCLVESVVVDQNGYAMQKITSCQSKTVIATRYCNKGIWDKWITLT